MPTIISTSSFSVTFDLTTSPGTFVLTDTFDYGSAGIPLGGVLDCFTITAPGGNVIYSNSNFANPGADIVLSGGTTNVIPLYIPVLPVFPSTVPPPVSGAPVPGLYTFVMTTQINDGVNPIYYVTTTKTANFTFVAPTISIVQTVDCIGANFTSTDTTNYVVDGITPLVIRNHDVVVPGNPSSPYTTPQQVLNLIAGQFYNGLQTTTITSTCTWTYPDGSFITATITGTKSIAVDCTYFCAIYCCLRSINNNIKKYKGVNDMLAAQYEAIFAKVMGLVELATLAYSCGKSNDVSGYVAQIQALADCTSDCSCQDGTPSPVYGLGGGGVPVNVQIQACLNGAITVTSTPIPNGTLWTICLDPNLVAKINGLRNTVVAAGTGISVSSANSTIAGIPTTTYTVASSVVVPNILSFKCTIEYQSVLPLVIVSQNNLQIDGTLFKAPTTITSINYGNPLWANSNNYFQFNDFLVTTAGANKRYKVFATLEPVSAVRTTAGAFYTRPRYFDVEILNTQSGTGQVYFRLVSANGSNVGRPVTNQQLIAERYTANIHFLLTTY